MMMMMIILLGDFKEHSYRCSASHRTHQNRIRSVRIFANWKTSYTTETNL